MAYHCPTCSRTILSRRNKLCGFCGNPIPEEMLFTAAEIAEIEAAERKRAEASQLREEEREAKRKEAARRNSEDGGGFVGFCGGDGSF